MLVATVTALIVLFSGGYNIFFAENVDKGIKEYVLEKDRKKELLDMTKEIKTRAKSYNKERKSNYKDFEILYTNYNTSEDELNAFFSNLTEIQRIYQDDFVEKRIEITERITDDEWAGIVKLSQEAHQKKEDKLAKKKQKTKEDFVKTKKKVAEIPNQENRDAITDQLDSFTQNAAEFEKELNKVNVLENELLVKKSNSKQELLRLYEDMNVIRTKAFESVIEFHRTVRANASQEQGEAVLSAFYKDLEIAPI